MKLKPGVKLSGIRPEMVLAALVADEIFAKHGAELTITSAIDGEHSLGSLHYQGRALDFRTRTMLTHQREPCRDALADALGTEFDVVLEDDHIHVEFDPKPAGGAGV